METADRVRLLVAPLVADAGASLYDLEYTGGVLRVTVERDGGVDIGTIGTLTRQISHLLDEADPIAGHYTLEVSSPGLERSLRRPEHFTGAIGSQVAIKTKPGTGGDRRVKGVLVAANDLSVTVEVADAAVPDDGERVIDVADIERARTVFEWGPAPKPGRPKQGAAKKSPSAKKKAARS